MNTVILVLLLLIVLILGSITSIMVYFLFMTSSPKATPPAQESKSLEVMATIMREEYDEKERQKQERELAEYARHKMRDQRPPQIRASTDQSERFVKVRGTKELVPFGWSENEKRLWEEFNNGQ